MKDNAYRQDILPRRVLLTVNNYHA